MAALTGHRGVRLAVIAGAVLILGACGEDGERQETLPTPGPTTPAPSPADEGLPQGWALCTNEAQGYAIGYPEDWQAGAPGLDERCTLFDPQPFEVERATEAPVTAMIVDVVDQSFQEMAETLTDPRGERLLTREDLTVGGRAAIRFEAVQTEDLLYPEGTRRYGYAVEADGRTVLVMTLDVAGTETDYEGNKDVVDRAVDTLRLVVAV